MRKLRFLALAALIFSIPECAHAAVAFRAKGAYGVGTTSCVAALPVGHTTNDILLILVESSDSSTACGTPNIPADWTQIFEECQGGGVSGATTFTIFGKRHDGSESDTTVDGVLNHCSTSMSAFSGAITTATAWSVGTGSGGVAPSASCADFNPTPDNVLMLCSLGGTRDVISAAICSAWTNANLASLTEREDNFTNTVSGGGICYAEGTLASGASGTTTVTMAGTENWRSVHVAIEPAPPSACTAGLNLPLLGVGGCP
jgi:hypothetical protein